MRKNYGPTHDKKQTKQFKYIYDICLIWVVIELCLVSYEEKICRSLDIKINWKR
jgi:hypothetical protein